MIAELIAAVLMFVKDTIVEVAAGKVDPITLSEMLDAVDKKADDVLSLRDQVRKILAGE